MKQGCSYTEAILSHEDLILVIKDEY